MNSYLQQLAMKQQAALGQSYGLGQLQGLGIGSGSATIDNAYRSFWDRNPYAKSMKDKPKDIRSELQQEVNEWLSYVDL